MEKQKFFQETHVREHGILDIELSADRLNATTGHVSIVRLFQT